MNITLEHWFSMGHTLHEYDGKCAHLHGHNYRLLVTVGSDELDDQGMVMDFSDLKSAIRYVVDDRYDHTFAIYYKDPRAEVLKKIEPNLILTEGNPTVEYLAKEIKNGFLGYFASGTRRIERIQLWETNNAYAEI